MLTNADPPGRFPWIFVGGLAGVRVVLSRDVGLCFGVEEEFVESRIRVVEFPDEGIEYVVEELREGEERGGDGDGFVWEFWDGDDLGQVDAPDEAVP